MPQKKRAGLLRVLGVGFGLAVIIGNTIGAGILEKPGSIAAQLPRAWMFIGVWIFGGLYALLGAFPMSELGAMMPRSGGYYVFARRAFGEYPAFVVGWTDFLAQCGSTAAVAIIVGEYSEALFPLLVGHKVAIASAVAVIVALLQWRGITWGSLTQNLTSAAKAIAFLILVGAVFFLSEPATRSGEVRPWPAHLAPLAAVILALQSVIFTYDGWYGVIYFGEEVKNPARDIPRSMFGGVLSVMAIYVLVNLALVYAMPMSQISGSDLAIGRAAAGVFGVHTTTFIRVLMIISMVSGINAYHLMASRIPFAMSQDGLVSHHLSRVNQGGTPTVALLMSTLAAAAFILTGSFEQVTAIMAFFFVADYALAYAAVFVLRRREPDTPRPYRAWGYPWTTGSALFGSIAILIGAIVGDTRNSLYSLLVLAASYPLYRGMRRLRSSTSPS